MFFEQVYELFRESSFAVVLIGVVIFLNTFAFIAIILYAVKMKARAESTMIEYRNMAVKIEESARQTINNIQELTKQRADAEMANRAKSAFLANMSFEMRTPMNVVVGLSDLMLEDKDLSIGSGNTIRENLVKINTAGNTLQGLINDILDISTIEAGKLELIPAKYDVPSLLNDIITLNKIRIEEKPIKFELDIDENLFCYLFGDELRVKQIINNILGNAFKYTRMGTVTLSMSCSPDRSTSGQVWVSVCISDTGTGINQEDLHKLFTAYDQKDLRTNKIIEGMGLSIARRLAGMMGGTISAESEYGKGSVFRISFKQGFVDNTPIGPAVAENLRNFRHTESKRNTRRKLVRPDLSHTKVLIVDDMQTNLDVAVGLLGKYKIQIDCALNGQEAVERIQRGTANGGPVYNAIFMDHMMPGMDGVETALAIRSIGTEYARNIPIIALTANAAQGMEKFFYANDFQGFISKPIDIMLLDSVVRKWVAGE